MLFLDSGIALCPHCRKAVKADGATSRYREAMASAYADAIAGNTAFWKAQVAEWAAEFGYDAVKKLAEWIRGYG